MGDRELGSTGMRVSVSLGTWATGDGSFVATKAGRRFDPLTTEGTHDNYIRTEVHSQW
jgi:aryl-alcohol dehydrogenase-like predicted oxidoreductase